MLKPQLIIPHQGSNVHYSNGSRRMIWFAEYMQEELERLNFVVMMLDAARGIIS
jgi:hypothetical protein